MQRISHVVDKDSCNEHPNFGVEEGFFDLSPFVVIILDTCFVGFEAFDGDETLALTQPTS